ncbi:hypothetical protein CF319_g9435, partial [Tilletia indica]
RIAAETKGGIDICSSTSTSTSTSPTAPSRLTAGPTTALPRPPTLSSVPALLVSLQNEYDAVILEASTLKKQYDSIREELTHLLYQNDAANRVIARLMNERDQAREALANIQASLGTGAVASIGPSGDAEISDAAGASSSQGVSEQVASVLSQTLERLSSQRRAKSKRKAPDGYTTAADLQQSFEQSVSIPSMHSTKPPGIAALDLSPATSELALTGGNDKVVQVYNRHSGKLSGDLHSLSFSENGYYLAVAAASSADVEVWDLRKVTKAASIVHPAGSSGAGAIQAVAFDPSAQFLAVVGPDV